MVRSPSVMEGQLPLLTRGLLTLLLVARRKGAKPARQIRTCDLHRRARLDHVSSAASFVQCGRDELGLGFGNQSPEKSAVTFSGSTALAHRRRKLELDIASGLHCRSEPDSADP